MQRIRNRNAVLVMSSTNNNIPKLRFPEFSGTWEKKKLGEIAKFSKGKGISKADISETGLQPCIRYGELYTHYGERINEVISYTSIESEELVLSKRNDVIIPASGESQIDIAKASCVEIENVALGGDLNIIRTPNNGLYLSYYLNSARKNDIARLAQGISVVHLYSSQLSTLDLSLPSLPEQQKIASFLTAVDDKLQALKKKKAGLERYKKGVMQQIFSQKLRFKDDDGKAFAEWERLRVGNLIYKVGEKNKNNISLPVYSINNKKGFIPQSEQFDDIDSSQRGYDISMYKIVNSQTFVYNPARINVGSIAYNNYLDGVIVSSLYVCFKTSDLVNDDFFMVYLNSFEFNNSVLRFQEGGVRQYLFFENFSAIKIQLPSLPEQTKIANFLSSIDEKIQQVEKKLAGMEQWKKGLLQKMFV